MTKTTYLSRFLSLSLFLSLFLSLSLYFFLSLSLSLSLSLYLENISNNNDENLIWRIRRKEKVKSFERKKICNGNDTFSLISAPGHGSCLVSMTYAKAYKICQKFEILWDFSFSFFWLKQKKWLNICVKKYWTFMKTDLKSISSARHSYKPSLKNDSFEVRNPSKAKKLSRKRTKN